MRSAALIVLALVLATPARAWQPPSGGPSKMAKRVLDSLPDPKTVPIPSSIKQVSRSQQQPTTTTPASPPQQAPAAGGCWEVQLTALTDGSRAEEMATQETTRLGTSVHVVTEGGLSKLRAGEPCLSYDEARSLRDRIMAQGYPGAFVIRVGSTGS